MRRPEDQASTVSDSDHKARPGGYVVTRVKTPMGNEVDSDSEEYRAWCEARYVMRMKRRIDRQKYLSNIRYARGDTAADQLAEKVLAIWKLSKP
jgi:hypothetical protein